VEKKRGGGGKERCPTNSIVIGGKKGKRGKKRDRINVTMFIHIPRRKRGGGRGNDACTRFFLTASGREKERKVYEDGLRLICFQREKERGGGGEGAFQQVGRKGGEDESLAALNDSLFCSVFRTEEEKGGERRGNVKKLLFHIRDNLHGKGKIPANANLFWN